MATTSAGLYRPRHPERTVLYRVLAQHFERRVGRRRAARGYLIYNHAAGIGEPAPIDHIRAAMVLRANVHANGHSGCRVEITQTLVEMLNRGVTPVVCEKGSVGACGDLAPMSQIALLMMGEGEAFFEGQRLAGRDALERAGIPVPGLHARDGLATINGSNLVNGARDQLRWTREQIEIEANGVGDNPIFLPDDHTVLTGANFQGTPVSLPIDTLGAAVTMVSVLSERRLNRLTNPALSVGLPPFLTKGAGMYSGLMLSQYTADTQIVEQRILSAPAFIQSIPAAADQEDFVSMGMNSALKTRQILDLGCGVLGIELMAAAQGLDLRDDTAGNGTRAAHAAVREHVEHLDEDRPLYADHNAMKAAVKGLDVLRAVESEIGELRTY